DCDDGLVCLDGLCSFCLLAASDDPRDLSPRCSPCGEASIQLPIAAPNVVFVVDKSASMVSHEFDHDGDPETAATTRWHALHAALFELLSTYDGSLGAGLSLFPSLAAKSYYDASACPVADAVEVPVAPMNGATVFSVLPSEWATSAEIAGASPTRLGLVNAVDHLSAQDDGLAAAIVLITDGAANCSPDAETEQERFEVYDAALVDVVADAAALGITTYVVGLDVADVTSPIEQDGEPDDLNNHAALSELAVAGGGATDDPDEPFYNAGDGPALAASLASIRDRLLPCDVALEPPPAFPEIVEIDVDGVVYTHPVRDCATEDGWRFTDDSFDHIELCGLACADFRAAGFATAAYRCALD
ncbi:MAG: VWA domain-containing protein, partial [Myxococcales bacterium]|nr:VWA domain-containing protein [Myxococcales bacterium]